MRSYPEFLLQQIHISYCLKDGGEVEIGKENLKSELQFKFTFILSIYGRDLNDNVIFPFLATVL